jgi:hypothetical protein
MRKTSVPLVLIAFTLLLISCQKEVEDIFATPGLTPPASDSNYISRFIEFDTTYSSGLDTFYKREWLYDASKRVKELSEMQFSAGTHDSDYTLHEYRFYNATDSVPYKVIRNEWFAGPERFTDTIFISYNSNKLIVKDSVIHYKDGVLISYIVTRFNERPDGSFWIDRTTDGGGGFFVRDSMLSRRIVNSGNILTASDSTYTTAPPALYSSSFYNYTYDSQHNPFLRSLLPYPVRNYDPSAIFQPFYYPVQSTLNNPLTHSQTHHIAGGTSVISGTCRYVYNNRGYPTIIRYSSSPLANPIKGLVFYAVF